MQIINGQMVDTDAIEALRDYYDREFDCSGFIEEPGHDDEELMMEIHKTQYDHMVESIHVLKQSYVNAKRYAKSLEDEAHDLGHQVSELKLAMMEMSYLTNWESRKPYFDEYEKGGLLTPEALPFLNMDIKVMLGAGITFVEMTDFTLHKYDDWKKYEADKTQDTE